MLVAGGAAASPAHPDASVTGDPWTSPTVPDTLSTDTTVRGCVTTTTIRDVRGTGALDGQDKSPWRMMNLVPNNGQRHAARHRRISGPARVVAPGEDEPEARFVPFPGAATVSSTDAAPPTATHLGADAPARTGAPAEQRLRTDERPGPEQGAPMPEAPKPRFDGTPIPSAPHGPGPTPSPGGTDPGDPSVRHHARPLIVLVGAPTLVVVILAGLLALYARLEYTSTEEVAEEIGATQDHYRAAADAERAVSRARVAASLGVATDTDAAFDRAAEVLVRQANALDDIVERSRAAEGSQVTDRTSSFPESVAALLAADRSYVDMSRQLIDLARTSPIAAQATLLTNRDVYEQRLADHEDLSDALSNKLDRLTGRLEDRRGAAVVVFPLLPLALAVVGLGLALWAWRSTVGPLRHVARTVERIARGDFRSRTNLEGNDDLGRVGRATDHLAERLGDRFSSLADDARRSTQNRVISETLEIADSEAATFAVVEQALGLFAPGLPGELLLIDSESGQLGEAVVSPSSGSPGCPVTDPADCVALRRGQSTVFESSESINGCPMLRDRPDGPVSAVCVPMTFNSSALGVLHITGPNQRPPDGATSDQFVDLASKTGTHLGALRTLELTRRQASTDGLTGLPNRQAIEARVAQLLAQRKPFVLVLADLDRFKEINDRLGHEAGDRALLTFTTVISENVRDADLVGRLGGDEFVIIYPELSMAASLEATERLRSALADVTAAGLIPPLTASFGVANSAAGSDFVDLVRMADAGLLLAKERGRDRAVSANPELVDRVFPRAVSPRR